MPPCDLAQRLAEVGLAGDITDEKATVASPTAVVTQHDDLVGQATAQPQAFGVASARCCGRAFRHCHAIEHARPGGQVQHHEAEVIEPRGAGVASEDGVEVDRLDRLFRRDGDGSALPVMCAGREGRNLPPELRPIHVRQVDVEGVVLVRGATDVFGLAPQRRGEGRGLLLVEFDRVGQAHLPGGDVGDGGAGGDLAAAGVGVDHVALLPGKHADDLAAPGLFEVAIDQHLLAGVLTGEDLLDDDGASMGGGSDHQRGEDEQREALCHGLSPSEASRFQIVRRHRSVVPSLRTPARRWPDSDSSANGRAGSHGPGSAPTPRFCRCHRPSTSSAAGRARDSGRPVRRSGFG